jgi:tRNA pseudouridine55 synthase
MPAAGILLVDKPGGMTSHDVVARARRALGTRKVGHAGTLDPMATGLLVLGVEGATRLLTFVVGADKTYAATIRFGITTDSDDADGVVTGTASPEDVDAIEPARIDEGAASLTGAISQVPSRVSAIKVQGRRAYDLVRDGVEVDLAARPVTVSRFEVLALRRTPGELSADVVVDCSSGTYVRALARDLGAALGVGAHLTALRRTRVGPFDLADAQSTDDIDETRLLSPAAAAGRLMEVVPVNDAEARDLRHGKRLAEQAPRLTAARGAAIDPDARLVGIVERRGADLKSAMNMPEDQAS